MKKEQSLRKSNDFKRLYQEGIKVRLGGFVFYFLKTNNTSHQLGIVASRKTGCAVARNRFRRRVRCLYALLCEKLQQPHNAIVIATSPSALDSGFWQIQSFFLKALEKLTYIENNGRVHA